jgi:hypothetical protein
LPTRARRKSRRRSSPLLITLALAAFACSAPTPAPRSDIEDASALAHQAAKILLQVSAYDYALAGALAAERTRTVTPERYATVARDVARGINAYSGDVIAASAEAAGPRRERLVALVDRMVELGRDLAGYAETPQPAGFAGVVGGARAGWSALTDLARALPADDALDATIAR